MDRGGERCGVAGWNEQAAGSDDLGQAAAGGGDHGRADTHGLGHDPSELLLPRRGWQRRDGEDVQASVVGGHVAACYRPEEADTLTQPQRAHPILERVPIGAVAHDLQNGAGHTRHRVQQHVHALVSLETTDVANDEAGVVGRSLLPVVEELGIDSQRDDLDVAVESLPPQHVGGLAVADIGGRGTAEQSSLEPTERRRVALEDVLRAEDHDRHRRGAAEPAKEQDFCSRHAGGLLVQVDEVERTPKEPD